MAKKQYEKLLICYTALDAQDVITSSTDPGSNDIGNWFSFKGQGGTENE